MFSESNPRAGRHYKYVASFFLYLRADRDIFVPFIGGKVGALPFVKPFLKTKSGIFKSD